MNGSYKIKVIINSRAVGKDMKRVALLIKKYLAEYTVDCAYTEYPGHAEAIARETSRVEYDMIVAVGGDGTINEIINGIIDSDLPLAIIPAGTANDLAVKYNIPSDIKAACEIIKEGQIHKNDTVRVNSRHFITTGGFGFPSDVIQYGARIRNTTAFGNYLTTLLGSWFYFLVFAIVSLYRYKMYHHCRLTIDNQSHESSVSSVIIGVIPFLGNHFRALPHAGQGKELLDICIIKKHTSYPAFLLTVVKILKGNHLDHRNINYEQAKSIRLDSTKPAVFFGDGEILGNGLSFEADIRPGSIDLIVPKERKTAAC